MQTINNPKQFTEILKDTRRVVFDNGKIRAEITIENPKTIHRAYSIKYFEKTGEKWIAFSTCVSSFIRDIMEDFNYECKQLNIN